MGEEFQGASPLKPPCQRLPTGRRWRAGRPVAPSPVQKIETKPPISAGSLGTLGVTGIARRLVLAIRIAPWSPNGGPSVKMPGIIEVSWFCVGFYVAGLFSPLTGDSDKKSSNLRDPLNYETKPLKSFRINTCVSGRGAI